VEEASAGNPEAAERRLAALNGIPLLTRGNDAVALGTALLRAGALPAKALADALHLATAAVHGLDYLLTWNCAHLANAAMRSKIEAVCRTCGFEPPILCTPLELTEI
jgi:hypothetical protein